MNRKNIFVTGIHILFCFFLVYWFYRNSFIRPHAIAHPYKELISVLLLLLIIYLNYLVLTPSILRKSYYKTYIILSISLVVITSSIELQLVKNDILKCFQNVNNLSFDINKYLLNVLFLTFLRNAGYYLFFTILALYQQTKAEAFLEKKEILKDTGFIQLPTVQGKSILININFVCYFTQNKNDTFIHWTAGNPSHVYSSLNYIQSYLDEYCLRINRDTIITFTNIASYNEKEVIIVDGKTNNRKVLPFYKKHAESILSVLRVKVPELDEKNTISLKKTQVGNINNDEKVEVGNIKAEILEAISKKSDINALKLFEIFHDKITLRTLRRRLKELKDAGKIEYKGSNKTGGYDIV